MTDYADLIRKARARAETICRPNDARPDSHNAAMFDQLADALEAAADDRYTIIGTLSGLAAAIGVSPPGPIFVESSDLLGGAEKLKRGILAAYSERLDGLQRERDEARAEAERLRAEHDKAVATLTGSGWTLEPGAAAWRPPVNREMGEALRRMFAAEDEAERLRATLEAAGVPRMGVDLIALEPGADCSPSVARAWDRFCVAMATPESAKAAAEPHADRSAPAPQPLESRDTPAQAGAGAAPKPPLSLRVVARDLHYWLIEHGLPEAGGTDNYRNRERITLALLAVAQPAGWPEPITDRLPTAEDGDAHGRVLVWREAGWQTWGLRHTHDEPWLRCPPAPGGEGSGRG